MNQYRFLPIALLAIFLSSIGTAATIHGTVYDESLKKVSNARVEITTIPKQFMITLDGSYSFNVPKGSYILKAYIMQGNAVISTQENITVEQDGSYVLDLILFPNLDEGLEDPGIDVTVIDAPINYTILGIAFALLIALAAAGYYGYYVQRRKGAKESEKQPEDHKDKDLEHIIKILKKEGGRATQKDIRKEMPYSEAKISLMLAELEHKGIVEKIKKGRGNIIILRKKDGL